MTFQKIITLSIIMFFALGSFALAEEPSESGDPCDGASTTASSTTASPSNDSKFTPTVAPSQKSVSTTTSLSDKTSKPEPKSVKKTTSSQNATSAKTPSTDPKAVSEEESNVTYVSPTQTHVYSNRNYGYSKQQIRNMPMVARPDRPGHFFGNTVRAFYRGRRGR